MDAHETTSLDSITIFPPSSINIVYGPSFVGKSSLVKTIISHLSTYFESPDRVKRVIIVFCNERVPAYQEEEDKSPVPIIQLGLPLFEPETLLEPGDLLIFEDVQDVTPVIRNCVNIYSHHYGLASLILIIHGLVGDKNYNLVKLCHRVIFFMRSGAVVKSFNYIIQEFFADANTKAYLKKVLGFCEQQKTTLLLEINPQVGQPGLRYLALSHLQHLPKGFALLYPYPHLLPDQTTPVRGVTPAMADLFDFDPDKTTFPPNTYALVPADSILRQKSNSSEHPQEACSDKRAWEDTLEMVEDLIEDYFPAKKWQRLKNLTKEILTHPHFCITKDGKTIQLHRQPKTRVPLMDYLSTATRQAGPSETLKPQYAVYVRMTKALVDNGSPASLFQNKLLLPK